MKKPALLAGLFLVPVILSGTVSAISSFKLGEVDITPTYQETTVDTDTDGHVLAASVEEDPPEESVVQNTAETEPADTTVTVEKGDSLSKIASRHDTTWKRLFDANQSIADPNIINPGDTVRIPAADEELASRPVPTPKPQATVARAATKRSTTPRSTTQRVVSTNAPAVASGSVWDQLAKCESGGNWQINTGNGYYGGLQFLPSTWRAVGGTGLPHQHSREEQIKRAEILLARSGWGQWPACTKKLGLR